VEEGLVNALIHRNYLELGSEVHIDMYDDRLEIFSPGGLLDGGSIKDMDVMNMASRRRNPVLADIFSRLKYMERRGSGFKKIVSAYKGHDGYTEGMDPKFSTPWNCFVLTLPKFNVDGVEGVYVIPDNVTEHGGQTGGQTSGQTDIDATIAEVLRLIKENPKITRKMLSDAIGVASSTIQKHINRLKDEIFIRRIGGDFGGYWEIINKEEK
jgi:ATP-dependent DNA helicase RecG